MENEKQELIRMITGLASKVAVDKFLEERDRERRRRIDKRLRDTKFLLRNYRQIKIHAGEAIASTSDFAFGDYEFFEDLLDPGENVGVEAIIHSRAKSAIMLSHIDAMITAYRTICYRSKRAEDQRRYRVLEAMYLSDEQVTVNDIADNEKIDSRTVYKDIDIACERMSALLFGVQIIDRE